MSTIYARICPTRLTLSEIAALLVAGIRHALRGLVLAIWVVSTVSAAQSPKATLASRALTIHYIPDGDIYEYRWKLLELALNHTRSTDGPFKMVHFGDSLGKITQSRSIVLLKTGEVDVLAFGSNQEREAELRPIRIDLLRGMLGYRILLIRKEDEAKFAALDLGTLRQHISLGFNSQWADLAILTGNGFKVVTTDGYDNLFYMLAARRFDAFPRGLNEAAQEIDDRKQQLPTLTMEKTLALFMDYPAYFWVRKDNAALADRIERGLKLSLADGTFRQLFTQYYAKEIAQVRREKRRVLKLRNPLQPEGSPAPDTSWWWPQ
jgi:hypothetical protein